MTDTVTVDRQRLEALERLYEAAIGGPTYLPEWFGAVRKAAADIPPKPEELIQLEGWNGDVLQPAFSWYARWNRDGLPSLVGPYCGTKAEAIRAGNEMLVEIAAKVQAQR